MFTPRACDIDGDDSSSKGLQESKEELDQEEEEAVNQDKMRVKATGDLDAEPRSWMSSALALALASGGTGDGGYSSSSALTTAGIASRDVTLKLASRLAEGLQGRVEARDVRRSAAGSIQHHVADR